MNAEQLFRTGYDLLAYGNHGPARIVIQADLFHPTAEACRRCGSPGHQPPLAGAAGHNCRVAIGQQRGPFLPWNRYQTPEPAPKPGDKLCERLECEHPLSVHVPTETPRTLRACTVAGCSCSYWQNREPGRSPPEEPPLNPAWVAAGKPRD